VTAGRGLRLAGGLASVTLLAAAARADAPVDEYGLFDMNTETIQDLRTGLTWQRYGPGQTFGLYAAAAYCQGLSLTTPSGLPSGWRVPSYKELLTLVDEYPHEEYENAGLSSKAIDGNAFPGTASAPYWSSSTFPGSSYAYAVDFTDGVALKQDPGSSSNVRCVHDP